MITFGAKAYHFSQTISDIYKAITRVNFISIPNGSEVWMSFGEIDCRPNEGFIPSAAKLNKPIEEVVADTVNGYPQQFAEQNKAHNHNLHFLNVSAPIYNSEYKAKINADVAIVEALFNAEIAKQIGEHKFNFIDVFAFTLGQDRFSNSKFHVDGYHLGPKVMPEIECQLNN